MKFNGQKFIRELMGRQVSFDQTYERVYDHNARRWEVEHGSLRVGWCIGATWLQEGRTHSGCAPMYPDYEGEPSSFEETAPRKLCYLVTTWPTNAPFKVPPENVKVVERPIKVHFHSGDERQALSEGAKKWPRDERGRFVRGIP